MKPHLFNTGHLHHQGPAGNHDNLKYSAVLVIGIPAAVFISRYMIEEIFRLLTG